MTGSEIPRKLMFGNFRKPKAERRHENSNWREKRPGMDPEHAANIRLLPCCIPFCKAAPGGQIHHLKDTGAKERSTGVRSTDKWGVPLCNEHHIYGVERCGSRGENRWFMDRGIAILELAIALWAARGDLARMRAIVLAVKQAAELESKRSSR